MKRLFIYMFLIAGLLVGCSTDNDVLNEGIEETNGVLEKSRRSNQIVEDGYTYIAMTIKYKVNVTEDQKRIIRAADYLFFVRKITATDCRNVETWHIRYINEQGGTQNGNDDGESFVDRDWLYKDTDLESVTERIEFNWLGQCYNF